jgi:DNA-binding LacI/PurR family transcriptional regulator
MPTATLEKNEANGAPHTPTIRDIARAVGVGKTTVSLVLNRQGNISPRTRRAVLRAAEKMGYTPNFHAQSLSAGRSQLVGLLSVATFPGIHTRTVEVLQDTLTERGFDAPLYGFGHRSLQDAAYQNELALTLRRQRPRAIVCHFSPQLGRAAFETLSEYAQSGGVLIGYGNPQELPCDHVAIDYENLVALSTRHLISLGHQRIGLFIPELNHPLETRPAAFRRVLQENGIMPCETWLFDGASFEEGGALLAQKFLRLKTRPTALDIINDMAASTFISGIVRAGLRVPEDVSVIGHDDAPIARFGNPALTTVAHPVEAVAHHVMDFLSSRLDGSYVGAPRRITLSGQLLIRESTAPYAGRGRAPNK